MIETYTQISQNLKNGKFSKIYLLMGEETFFTDKISNFFQNKFIDESLKEFNLEIHYGKDSSILKVLNSCKSFPMMSDKKLIIVKEAQELDVFKTKNNTYLNHLIEYIKNPNQSSTVIYCIKNKKLDKRGKLYKSFLEHAIILDSDAKEDALKLVNYFNEMGITTYIVNFKDKDPSEIGFKQFWSSIDCLNVDGKSVREFVPRIFNYSKVGSAQRFRKKNE